MATTKNSQTTTQLTGAEQAQSLNKAGGDPRLNKSWGTPGKRQAEKAAASDQEARHFEPTSEYHQPEHATETKRENIGQIYGSKGRDNIIFNPSELISDPTADLSHHEPMLSTSARTRFSTGISSLIRQYRQYRFDKISVILSCFLFILLSKLSDNPTWDAISGLHFLKTQGVFLFWTLVSILLLKGILISILHYSQTIYDRRTTIEHAGTGCHQHVQRKQNSDKKFDHKDIREQVPNIKRYSKPPSKIICYVSPDIVTHVIILTRSYKMDSVHFQAPTPKPCYLDPQYMLLSSSYSLYIVLIYCILLCISPCFFRSSQQ